MTERQIRAAERKRLTAVVMALPSAMVPRADFEWSGERVRVLDRALVLRTIAKPPEPPR